jgi:hypothetical protein
MSSLTEKQLTVIDDLFESGGDENTVLQKHNISRTVLQDWLKDKAFSDEIADRLNSSKLHSKILLSKYASFAATKLIGLCQSENQETSRKACLDILSLEACLKQAGESPENQSPQAQAPIDAQTASKILAVLAE